MATRAKNISAWHIYSSAGAGFGDVWYNPGGEYGPRVERAYQFQMISMGEMHHFGEADQIVVPAGYVGLLLPGYQKLSRFSREHLTHLIWSWIDGEYIPDALQKRLPRLPSVLPCSTTFDHIAKAALGVRGWRKKHGQQMLRTLSFAIMEEYIRLAQEGSGEKDLESPCERARLFLEENSEREDCLPQAYRKVGVTRQHLARLFQAAYGITPTRYLWQLRIERGAGLLKATGLTVAEIADRCGFKTPFHFSRLLKKMEGISPRELRRRSRAGAR